MKQLEQYDEKSTIAETFQNKIGQWTVRQLKKLSAIDKKNEEAEHPKSIQKLKDVFNKYLSILKSETDILQLNNSVDTSNEI